MKNLFVKKTIIFWKMKLLTMYLKNTNLNLEMKFLNNLNLIETKNIHLPIKEYMSTTSNNFAKVSYWSRKKANLST